MTNHFMRRALAWILVLPALGVLGCSGDSATSNSSVRAVRIPQSDYVVGLGGTRQIDLFAYDDRDNSLPLPTGISWSSSDPLRVTVDASGNARGMTLGGPVTITASMRDMTATTRVTVRPASVSISPALDSVSFGQSVQLTATARDANGAPVEAGATTWSVTPDSVATISPTGLLTAGTGGMFTVTATVYFVTAQVTTGVSSAYDGTWVGTGTNTYGEPQAVRFNVRFGSIGVFVVPDIRTTCGPQTPSQYVAVLGVPVVDGRFTYGPYVGGTYVGGTIIGTFTSPTTLSGNYTGIRLVAVACPDGGMASPIGITSAFTATKQ